MTIDDLKNLRDYHAQIASLKARIARLRDTLTSVSSPQLSHTPQGGGLGDPVGNGTLKLVGLEQELCDKISQLESRISRIETVIDALPPRERSIIRARCVDGLSWKKVGKKTGYCEEHCKKIYSKIKFYMNE